MIKFKPFVVKLSDGRRIKAKYWKSYGSSPSIKFLLQEQKLGFFWVTSICKFIDFKPNLITSPQFMYEISKFVVECDKLMEEENYERHQQRELNQYIKKISTETLDIDPYAVMDKLTGEKKEETNGTSSQHCTIASDS